MHIRCYNSIRMILAILVLFFCSGITCKAEEFFQNPETGYYILLEDECDLLTQQDEEQIIALMKEISAYGNVGFLSGNKGQNSRQTADIAEAYYIERFGDNSGTLFFIDMKSRYLYIYSNGEMYDVITRGYAETITDNIYKDATRQEYGTCAVKAYSQMLSLLQGQRISQPMKYISNTLLGIAIGFLFTFMWVLLWYKKHAPQRENKLEMVKMDVKFVNTNVTGETVEEMYYPAGNPYRNNSSGSSSGSSSGGGFGGGSFGGGGSSGGGGGHSF